MLTVIQHANFGYIFLAAVFLVWAVSKICRSILLVIFRATGARRDMEKLLLDIKDGTKRFYKEMRRFPRAMVKCGIIVKIAGSNVDRYNMVLNISRSGALLRTHVHFQPGDQISMKMYLPLFPQPVDVETRIIKVVAVWDIHNLSPLFDVGVEFLNIIRIDNDKLVETVDTLLKSERNASPQKIQPMTAEVKRPNESYGSLRRTFFSHTIRTLMCFMDYKDRFTCRHSKKVVKYSTKIARALGMRKYEILKIKIAALFHDIGKSHIDRTILNKPGKLTPEEWQEVKKHPAASANIIKETGVLREIVDIIRYHHKHFDGNGYPDLDKKGEDIPLGSRILAIADSYDAMISSRPYRAKPVTKKKAIIELKRCAGSQFDPRIVAAFIKGLKSNSFSHLGMVRDNSG